MALKEYRDYNGKFKLCLLCGEKLYGKEEMEDDRPYALYMNYPECTCEKAVEKKELECELNVIKYRLNTLNNFNCIKAREFLHDKAVDDLDYHYKLGRFLKEDK